MVGLNIQGEAATAALIVLAPKFYKGVSNPEDMQTSLGILDAVVADSQRQNSEDVKDGFPLNRGDGTIVPTASIRYQQRDISGDTSDVETCGPCDPKPYFVDPIVIGNVRQTCLKIDVADFNALLPADMAYETGTPNLSSLSPEAKTLKVHKVLRDMFLKMDALRTDIAKDIYALFAANIGTNARTGDNLPTPVDLLVAANGNVVKKGFLEISRDFKFANQYRNQKPMIIAGGLAQMAIESSTNLSADQFGSNPGVIVRSTGNYFPDNIIDSELGLNQMLVIAPNVTRLITKNINVGPMDSPMGEHYYTTMPDPLYPGLVYDVHMFPVNCAEGGDLDRYWNVFFTLRFGMHFIPAGAYKVGDPLFGVNGVFRYLGMEI
jgi:hypothetical protein